MTVKHSTDKLSSTLLVIIILAIVAVANVLGNRFFTRLDLTENKLYTLSDVTKQMLSELDDVVAVRAYFSEKLPVQIRPMAADVDDMLNEYRIYSSGNINYERLDPSGDEELQRKLAGQGIGPVQMTIVEKDERQQINGYLAMAVSYGEKTEAIPVVQSTDDLEYELTSRIYRVTHEPKRVGFVTSFSRHDINQDYSQFAQEVRKLHEIEPVDLAGETPVPEGIETLIMAGPADSVSLEVQYALDQFIMRGGRVIFLVDAMSVDPRGMPTPVNHGLDALIAHYGFNLHNALVADKKSHSPRAIRRGIFLQQQPFPLFPRVTSEQLGEHPMVARLSGFTLPYTGYLDFANTGDSTLAYTALAISSRESESYAPPAYRPAPNAEPVIFAGLGAGTFTSFFKDKPRPDAAGAGETFLGSCERPASILVVPSSTFLVNETLYPGNMEFMLNAVDFMTIGDRLISIRTRPRADRPLKTISGEMKNFLRILNIIGVPVLVIFFGMMRFYLKRRDKAIHARAM
ncbi:MAG: GldG family protein [Gemmatimonadota bacterium]|nr:GldG family protein [Gemmatimonadota bacterium]